MNENAGVKVLAAVIGFWMIMRAINRDSSGRTLIDHVLGQGGGANQAATSSTSTPAVSLKSLTSLTTGANPRGTSILKAVNPVPGAVGSRLDQGFDLTSKTFESPYAGTVVAEENSDPGWAGGGYVAIANAADPSQVEFFAEGLLPTVQKGQTVTAGQRIAIPARNPYNAITGNIETGPANPKNPLQPLAQVVSDPAAVVTNFYDWLRGLGAPAATSTALAGHA